MTLCQENNISVKSKLIQM